MKRAAPYPTAARKCLLIAGYVATLWVWGS
jgi:hypothetical protein